MPPKAETEKGFRAQLEAAERAIRTAWSGNVEWLQTQQTVIEIAALIEEHRLAEIVGDGNVTRFAEAIAAAVSTQYMTAARVVADYLTRKLAHPVHFDPTDGRAMLRIQRNTLGLVREITNEVRGVIRNSIRDGIELGTNPRAHARMIRGSLGLTEKQYDVVKAFRAKLEANDGSALSNKLRDRRHDGTIDTARRTQRPLTPKQIDTMVARYQQRWVKYRSEAIARTEALRSVHEGAEDMWAEIIGRGDVAADALEKIWLHKKLGRNPRENHKAMHGQKRAIGESFRSPSGVLLRYPGDPDAPPSETVHCGCLVVTRFKRSAA